MPDIKRRLQKKSCHFCKSNSVPYYREVDTLSTLMSERKRILPALYTAICSKHQRQTTKAIKQARYLALLPYTSGLS